MEERNPPTPNDLPANDPESISLDGAFDNPARFPNLDDSPVGFVQVDFDRQDSAGDRFEQDPGERDKDLFTVGTDSDLVIEELAKHTNDPDVLDDFAERQELGSPEELLELLRNHHSNTPIVSGEDVDADWERAEQVGEEAVGGTVPTPDQDVVEELGAALGILYDDNEPLDTFGKLTQRDEHRFELDPASRDSSDLEDDEENLSLDELEAEEEAAEDEEDVDIEDLLEEEGLLDDDEELEDDDETALEDDWEDDDDDWDDDEIDDDFLLGGVDIDDED
jgi:hypothetical protein